MPQAEELKKLILTHQRRLLKLKEQQAVFGASVDPSVLIQIEDIETELARLCAELEAELNSPSQKETQSSEVAVKQPKILSLPAILSKPVWLIFATVTVLGLILAVGFILFNKSEVAKDTSATEIPPPIFTVADFPIGALSRPLTRVLIAAFPGCDGYELKLEQDLKTNSDVAELINSKQLVIERLDEPHQSTGSSKTEPPEADLLIWGECAEKQVINFELLTPSGPAEVYSPKQLIMSENDTNPMGEKIALGLIFYQRRDFDQAARKLDLPSREAQSPIKNIVTLLRGNSLLFQQPPAFDKAMAAYEAALPDSAELKPYLYNNHGVAAFSQGMGPGEYDAALESFDQAIALDKNEGWFYYNHAFAQLSKGEFEAAIEDCQLVQQQAIAHQDASLLAAGYTCQTEAILFPALSNATLPDKDDEIRQILGNVPVKDWYLVHFVRGTINANAQLADEAKQAYTCYLLSIRDTVKLPFEQLRIDLARKYLATETESLETTCRH